MIKQHKATFLFLVLSLWGLLAANGVKDFWFEMRSKARGEIITYSSLAEFCGWTGDKKLGETDFDYALRRIKNMASAMLVMSFLSVLFFGAAFGTIFAVFYYSGAFKDEEA